jgi:hypothetical protein
VNEVLNTLLSEVQGVLSECFVGMYLYGSLALGDFVPERSDIDFLVVTDDELSQDMVSALCVMHERIAAGGSRWSLELEGSYIPRASLRRYDPANARHPHIDREGRLQVEQHDSDWVIQRHVLREWGVTLAGPPPHTLIDPISQDDLRGALVALMRGWWGPMRHDPFRLRHSGYQAYAVLTMCRVLYTMQHGTIVSKSFAARWAQEALGDRWRPLIERALAWPKGRPGAYDVAETVELIAYALDRCER